MTIILFTVLFGVLVIYLLFRWSDRQNCEAFAARNVPYIPFPNAFLSVLRKDRMELWKEEVIKKMGLKVFGFNQMNRHTILVARPEIAAQVLSKEFTNFTNRRNLQIKDPILEAVLSFGMDDQWKRLRSIVTPTFSAGNLRQMKSRIDETVHDLLRNFERTIQKQEPFCGINVKPLFDAYTMDTIIQVAFGTKVDSLAEPNNPILVHARNFFANDLSVKQILKSGTLFLLPKIARFFGIRFQGEALDFFKEFSEKIIREKKEELKQKINLGKASCFLELILEAEAEQERLDSCGFMKPNRSLETNKKGGKFMTTNEMVAQCVLFFLAGYETIATTITLTFYLLALHPETQEKLYQEIESVIEKLRKESGESSTKDPFELITLDTLPRLKYLTGVVNETLRIHGPTIVTERVASKDITLRDGSIRIDVKKGDVVQFPIYSMHRDPEQWPEPERFDPTRFIGENPTFHKYAYLPFGQGPRNCVAKSLALLEAKLAVLHTVRLFKFSRCEQTKVPFEIYFQNNFITPRNVILKVEKRQTARVHVLLNNQHIKFF